MPIKECRKTLRNRWIVDILPSKRPGKIFQGITNYHRNYLNAYNVERPNLTRQHCGCLCPARVIASSFNCWLTMQIFPGADLRNSSWMICVLLCPQNLKNLRRIWKILFILDPNYLHWIWSRPQLFTLKGIICSCRIQIICNTLKVCDSHWVKKAFVPGLNLFIPGPKY